MNKNTSNYFELQGFLFWLTETNPFEEEVYLTAQELYDDYYGYIEDLSKCCIDETELLDKKLFYPKLAYRKFVVVFDNYIDSNDLLIKRQEGRGRPLGYKLNSKTTTTFRVNSACFRYIREQREYLKGRNKRKEVEIVSSEQSSA